MRNELNLPREIEVEEAILGSCINEPKSIDSISQILKPEMFYNKENSLIYQFLIEMRLQDHPIDLITLANFISKSGNLDKIGSVTKLTHLSTTHFESYNVIKYAFIVNEAYMKRTIIINAQKTIQEALDPSKSLENLHKIVENSMNLFEYASQEAIQNIHNVTKEHFDHYNLLSTGKGKYTQSTHLPTLNKMLPGGGFSPGELVILAARPSMGKTAVALDIFKNMENPALFVSLEMTNIQLMNRMLLGECDFNSYALKEGRLNDLEFEKYTDTLSKFNNRGYYFDDKSYKLTDVIFSIKKAVKKHNIKVAFVDYLQIIVNPGTFNRERQVAEISAALKRIAKAEKITVVALSQLSRDSSKENRRPKLSDLRDSGAIEQDADIVGFIHRNDYHDNLNGGETINQTLIIIAKNRDGELGEVTMNRNKTFSKYWETRPFEPDPDFPTFSPPSYNNDPLTF